MHLLSSHSCIGDLVRISTYLAHHSWSWIFIGQRFLVSLYVGIELYHIMIVQPFGLYNMSITKSIGNQFLFIFPLVATNLPHIICQEQSLTEDFKTIIDWNLPSASMNMNTYMWTSNWRVFVEPTSGNGYTMRLSSRIAPVPSKQFHIGRAAYSTLES